MIDINKWEIKKLVAQCVFPRLSVEAYAESIQYKNLIKQLTEMGVGGFCVFNATLDSVAAVIGELQSVTDIPLLFCCDMEHGVAMRVDGATEFPHAMACGKTGDVKKTAAVAQLTAREAKALGIRWNLAPVADINSNKDNPVINIRSFAEDAETVSKHVYAYVKATQAEHTLACAKHFPGHGNTSLDSHMTLPEINVEAESIYDFELLPFISAIKAEVKSIMIAHLSAPSLDDSKVPASLSEKIIKGLLRDKLGYQGLILTDALDMAAITKHYPTGAETVKAFKAGNDIALMPENPFAAIEAASIEAEMDNEIADHLRNSVRRIIKEKRWCGLLPQRPERFNYDRSNFLQHEKIALAIAQNALEIDAPRILIPLPDDTRIAGFAFLQKDEDMKNASLFFKFLAQAIENDIDFGYLDETILDDEISKLRESVKDADIFVFVYFYKGRASNSIKGDAKRLKEITSRLAGDKEVINIFFGNPYLADEIPSSMTFKTYSDSISSIASVIMALTGR